MSVSARIKQFVFRQEAATASEYATILAVVVIAFMVSVNIVGRKVNKTVRSVDHRLIRTSGAAGSGGDSSAASGDAGGDSGGSEGKGGPGGPSGGPAAASGSTAAAEKSKDLGKELGVLGGSKKGRKSGG